jgi:hypothetical protein
MVSSIGVICPLLKTLSLPNAHLSSASFRGLTLLSKLERLHAGSKRGNDGGVIASIQALGGTLRGLVIHVREDESWDWIGRLTRLEHLSLHVKNRDGPYHDGRFHMRARPGLCSSLAALTRLDLSLAGCYWQFDHKPEHLVTGLRSLRELHLSDVTLGGDLLHRLPGGVTLLTFQAIYHDVPSDPSCGMDREVRHWSRHVELHGPGNLRAVRVKGASVMQQQVTDFSYGAKL